MLGDLLANLTDDATTLEAVLGAGDLALLTGLRQHAAEEGVDLATYICELIQRYANEASDEEWITLMGAINRSLDPGLTCLKRAYEHDLRH